MVETSVLNRCARANARCAACRVLSGNVAGQHNETEALNETLREQFLCRGHFPTSEEQSARSQPGRLRSLELEGTRSPPVAGSNLLDPT
jgi:hypothetical protein